MRKLFRSFGPRSVLQVVGSHHKKISFRIFVLGRDIAFLSEPFTPCMPIYIKADADTVALAPCHVLMTSLKVSTRSALGAES